MAVILEVESSISGIPGPPTGPSYLTTIISLFSNLSGVESKNLRRSFSPLKTLAKPLNKLFSRPPSTPANFNTALCSGDKFPPSRRRPPVCLNGFWTEYITSPSGELGDKLSTCSANVIPVQVITSPFRSPASNKSFTKT